MSENKTFNKLINLRPIVLACCLLVVGIFCSFYSFKTSIWFSILPLLSFVIVFIVLGFIKTESKKTIFIFALISLTFFSLGHLLTDVRINKVKNLEFTIAENEVFIGRICDATYNDSYIRIEFDSCNFKGKQLEGKTVAFIYSSEAIDKIDIGSILKCDATLMNRYYSGGTESDIFGGLFYEITELDNIQVIGTNTNFYEIVFLKVRSFLRKNLSKEGYAMVIALTLGNTSYLPVETLQTYRFAGIAHVFAVSGLHIGVFVSIFTFIASRLKIKRNFKPFIILIPAFIYCGVCGFRSSSVRAFIMATVTIVANYIGFKKDNLSSASIAGIILLIINPMNLFDAGFKLSFLAVSSIFVLNPLFDRGAKSFKAIGSGLSVSLSAQLATLPVLTDMSGYISIISVFANLIFVPVVVILYVITLVFVVCSALVGSLFSSVASIILSVPDYLLNACNFLISKIDYSSFALPTTFSYFKISWYMGLACLSDAVNLSYKQKLIISCVTLTATVGGIILTALI